MEQHCRLRPVVQTEAQPIPPIPPMENGVRLRAAPAFINEILKENEDSVRRGIPSAKTQVDAAKTEFFRTLMKSPVPKPSRLAAKTLKEAASLNLKEVFVMPENHLFIIGRMEFCRRGSLNLADR
uniref:Uncharacterized protein n=1 Tax=Salix viminalis TaxID=40686 RepID=A0A6N2KRW8_SALVM